MDEQPEHPDETPAPPELPPEAPAATARETAAEAPDFGPGGYLPERASKRARKIILRAPMGIQWVIGSLAVGVVVVIAGWFALRDQAPTEPYVEVPAGLVEAADGVALWDHGASSTEALVVTAGNRSRVFAWGDGDVPVLCDESGLLEATDGRAWRLTGRGLGGTPSLVEHPVIIHDGVLYADPMTTLDPLVPDPDPADTACT